MGVFHTFNIRGGSWGSPPTLGLSGVVKAYTEQDGAGAYLEVQNSGDFPLARFIFQDPAWDDVAVQSELRLIGVPYSAIVLAPASGGTAANKFRLFTATNSFVFGGTSITGIGGGGDLELSELNLSTPGQTIRLTSFIYRTPA